MSEKKPPETIYLQDWESPTYEDTSWCSDQINDELSDCPDIEYIRADLVTQKDNRIQEAYIELLRLSGELLKIEEPKSIKAFASEIKQVAEALNKGE